MKNIPLYLLKILLIFIIIPNLNLISAQTKNEETFVTKFDADLMSKKYLVDFKFVRKNASWNLGREFVYESNKDKEYIFITIGLHSSSEAANDIVQSYLKGISGRMVDGINNKILLGDKFWWWSPNLDSSNITNIIFIRKNSLFILSCSQNFKDLMAIAKNIDQSIINNESFVLINSFMVTPEIKTITTDKEIVKPGDSAKITISAEDHNNEALEYQFSPGLKKQKKDLDNVFTFTSSSSFVNKTTGVQTVKVIAINESNAVSPVKELKMKDF